MSEAQQAQVLQLLLEAAGESEEECRAGGWWLGARGCLAPWAERGPSMPPGRLLPCYPPLLPPAVPPCCALHAARCLPARPKLPLYTPALPRALHPTPALALLPLPPAVVAECLGSLALLNGALVLPRLQASLPSPSGEPRLALRPGWRCALRLPACYLVLRGRAHAPMPPAACCACCGLARPCARRPTPAAPHTVPAPAAAAAAQARRAPRWWRPCGIAW